jgi:uncharacterized protein UPF0259
MPVNILRPLSLGEVLDASFGLYRRLFAPLLLVTVATRALPIALEVYIEGAGGAPANPELWLTNLTLSAILGALASGASTFVVSEECLGRRLSAGDALRRTVPFIGPLIMLALLTTLIIGLGVLLFIIPGLILLSGLLLGTPAMVLEGLGSVAAMGRSWNLTRGHRRKVFNAILAVGLLLFLPGMALGVYGAIALGTSSVEGGQGWGGYLGLTIVVYLLSTLIYPLLYCVMTVSYYDLRVRKEGFDLEVLAAELTPA